MPTADSNIPSHESSPLSTTERPLPAPQNRQQILCGLSPSELHRFQSLLGLCFAKFCTATQPTYMPTAAINLIDYCSFRAQRSVSTMREARAISGLHWLYALDFLQALADHLASQTDRQNNKSIFESWHSALFLAAASETLARTTQHCRALDAWLCGLLLGSVHTAMQINANGSPACVSALDVARLLTAFNATTRLALPDTRAIPTKPWNVLSTAQMIVSNQSIVSWATNFLIRIPCCTWPIKIKPAMTDHLLRCKLRTWKMAHTSWKRACQKSPNPSWQFDSAKT